jgi:3-keto-disaccharide hydrolase
LLLFDGKSTRGWMNSDGSTPRTGVTNGLLNPHKSGHYMLVHTQQWSNFLLSLDFKISKGSNSGVFVRTSSAPRAAMSSQQARKARPALLR